jgi:competence protein ComEC
VGLSAALVLPLSGLIPAAVALALGAVALVARRQRTALLAAALLVAGCWWGTLRLADLDGSVLVEHVGRTALAHVEVTGPARTSEFALRVPIQVVRFDGLAVQELSRLELPVGRVPAQGAVLEVVASVRLPRPADGGGFDEAFYLKRQGVQVVLRADGFTVVGRRGGLGGVADAVRAAISGSLARGLDGERRAVVTGVVLGGDDGLDDELRERFRASGLYHLLAVSGQNVGYVVAGVLLLGWLLGLPRRVAQVGALTAVCAYVLAVGWQPSVVRAGVAGMLASLAWLAARPQDRWYFLLVGAAVLLAWNPYSLLEPGFQLSFTAVAAIFLLVPSLERRLEGYPIRRELRMIVAVSVACGVATAPILMGHFDRTPVYSIVANALAAPVVAPLLALSFGAAALGPIIPSAALALAWLAGWLGAYVAACARFVGGLPHAEIASWRALLALAGAAAFAWLLVRLPPPRGRRALALVALAATLLVAWRARPEHVAPPPTGLRITFLDAGQGDAILLQVREGAVLVDQGPPEAEVAQQLRGLGIRRLAALVLTHPQRDHVGGAADVLARLDVEAVLDPRLPVPSPYERDALDEARERGIRVVLGRAGSVFRLGRLRLRFLWPGEPGLPTDDPNDHAIVLVASFGRMDALLTADAETNVTLPLRPPPVEILKVAHHGSADPGLPALLALIRPQVAVISVGAGNDYGHPAPSTLAALARAPELDVYRTDEDGRVTIESDGIRFAVRADR